MTDTVDAKYGVDIAIRRADDLDKIVMHDVATATSPCIVLDVGAGVGGQSARLVRAGATVHAIDIGTFQSAFVELRDTLKVEEDVVSFQQGDIRTVLSDISPDSYTHAVMQRMLHYVPYYEASEILHQLTAVVTQKLYISVTGVDSAIGVAHAQRLEPVSSRFSTLPRAAAEAFSISVPLCVYTREELSDLLKHTGWTIERLWVSAFGNIKAVAHRKV